MSEVSPQHNTVDLLVDHLPVAEFSAIKGIPEAKVIDMIREGFYTGRIKNGQWFVHRREITKADTMPGDASQNGSLQATARSKNVFLNLINGRYGMALTFWLWGVGVSVIYISVVMAFADSMDVGFFVGAGVIWGVYLLMVLIGFLQTGKGNSLWNVVLKIGFTSLYAFILSVLLFFMAYALSDYPNH